MATISWTLEVAGVLKAFKDWSASIPSIVYRSMEEDTAQFIITGDITTDCPVSYGNRIRIFRRVDAGTPVCWFVGTCTGTTARGGPKTSEWVVRCSNFWFQLAQTMFQQTLVYYDGGCVKVTTSKTTKVVLFQDPRTGAAITTGKQMRNAIDDAHAAGITVDIGTAPDFIAAPFEPARELTLADVIRRAMQYTPDGVSWADYSSGAAVVSFQQRASLSATSLSVTASPSIIQRVELRRRDDLVPLGVKFNFIGMVSTCHSTVPNGCIDDTTGLTNTSGSPAASSATEQVTKLTVQSVGTVSVAGAVVATIDLAQMSDSTNETIPASLADNYYNSLVLPPWEGEVVTLEPECSGSLRPGKVLNITGGNTSWVAMRAMIQEVREDLETGETTATLGLPTHLGPQDFVTLIQMTRRRPLIQDAFPATRPPGADDTNCTAGKDPSAQKLLNNLKGNGAAAATSIGASNIAGKLGTVDLDVCQDGTAGVQTVYAPGV